jgi:crossover junction endodeoxyribonuclease RusA
MSVVSFFVPGKPAGKGSLRAFARADGGVGVEEGNADKVRPWMHAIAASALEAGVRVLEDGSVGLVLIFRRPRPKSHTGAKGNLKPSAPSWPTTKPDIDKLARAVLDALTGVAYRDDSQVVRLEASKRFALSGEVEGVQIVMTRDEVSSEATDAS